MIQVQATRRARRLQQDDAAPDLPVGHAASPSAGDEVLGRIDALLGDTES